MNDMHILLEQIKELYVLIKGTYLHINMPDEKGIDIDRLQTEIEDIINLKISIENELDNFQRELD